MDFDSMQSVEELETITWQTSYSGNGLQCITFMLGGEKYGVNILKVRELINYTHFTVLPNVPAHIKGVLNLRGLVVPVVDLRNSFGMPELPYTKYTVIIIVQVGVKLIGLVVDSVSDVVFIPDDKIQSAPEFSEHIDTRFITGIGRVKDNFMILLDIEGLLASLTENYLPSIEPKTV